MVEEAAHAFRLCVVRQVGMAAGERRKPVCRRREERKLLLEHLERAQEDIYALLAHLVHLHHLLTEGTLLLFPFGVGIQT